MDRFTRNYSIVLGLALVALVALWVGSNWNPRVWELNDLLETDTSLSSYPYQFRVIALDNGIATLSTPRSFDVPAVRFLAIIHPELAGADPDDRRMVAAQQDLANHQRKAQALIARQPDVKAVRWRLDTEWLADRGVHMQGRP